MNFMMILNEFVKDVAWAVTAAIAMSAALAILLAIYNKLTPQLDEMQELKKGNIAVAIVMAAVILSYGFVVGMMVR
ncbi:MAG: DUF350 domain-containing protein [Candidatus Eremiobacteraeota bacterium]|nr:DUF350 domain-containing protein [Candidatus Eremiobacteraeota bacterium]